MNDQEWLDRYRQFLDDKAELAPRLGFDVAEDQVHPICKPHQRDIVRWCCAGGRRAIFASFGLGKSVIQLDAARLCLEQLGGEEKALIIAPLGVKQEFMRDAAMLGIELRFIRRTEELDGPGIYITNYESIRDDRLDHTLFPAVSLDEAAVLRSFGGTKTFRAFMAKLAGDDREQGIVTEGARFRFVATATPAPNELLELVAYGAFLGIMDVGQAKTRFFKRDSQKADNLTLLPHREEDFWHWVASWAVFVDKPSDLGHDDEGYVLPEMAVRWHEIPSPTPPGADENGQQRLLKTQALGVTEAAAEKRESLGARLEKAMEIIRAEPEERFLIWHDLEAERRAIERVLGGDVASVYGSQKDEDKEERIIAFSDGEGPRALAAKPVMLGSGCNFQRHCRRAVFLGIGFKFKDFIQAVHRIYRFLQPGRVEIDLIYTSAERGVRELLERKWETHEEMRRRMQAIVKEHGLSAASISAALRRRVGVEREESTGPNHRAVCDDSVVFTRGMAPDSVDLILTSPPFSMQYEYTPQLEDMGHSRDNDHFMEHLGWLVPELYRVLKPGRIAAIHVKDRNVPGGINGLGFQTVYPFSDKCRDAFEAAGFAFMARITIVTDVVRENNQTYRLGWTENGKDGTKMGAGMPEYMLIFRKPPSDSSNSYADEPVRKEKPRVIDDGRERSWRKSGRLVPGTGYSRSRWQIDAHGFWRSSGDRLIDPEELVDLPSKVVFQAYRRESLAAVYDHEDHVKLGELLEQARRLPVKFMLLQPQSWTPEVWSDIMRAQTLNVRQGQRSREHHLCPMQFDVAERIIRRYSNPGEVVYDPFAGLFSVPYVAIRMNRYGLGCELSPLYYSDGCAYLDEAEAERAAPSLFDLLDATAEPDDEPALAMEATA